MVRLAGGGCKAYDQLGFTDWRSGIAAPLRFSASIGFDQSGWSGASVPQTAGIRFFPSDKSLLSSLASLVWKGAEITISTGDDEDAAPTYTTQFVGTVAECKSQDGALSITLADLSTTLDKPACPDTFAGTGDLEGIVEATGRVKRRTWGKAFNVEGRVLDKAYNVYEFGDPNRPINAFVLVKDKGRSGPTTTVAWAGSALATLVALRAATPPDGGAAVAPSIACVKWWTIPSGPLTADIEGEIGSGYVNKAADIAARIVSIYNNSITIANLATALTWQGGEAGLHVDSASETVANILDRLLLPVRTAWLLGSDGVLTFRLFTWAGPVEALVADTVARETVFQPLDTRKLGFQKNHRIHSDGEISAAVLATDVNYPDGTPISDLQPGESGATRNDDGANMIGAGVGLERFLPVGGPAIVVFDPAGVARPADRTYIELAASATSKAYWDDKLVPVVPGDTIYYGHVARLSATTADSCIAGYDSYGADGSLIGSGTTLSETTMLGSEATGVWTPKRTSFLIPAGVAFIRAYVSRPAATGTGVFDLGEPYLSRSQQGADVSLNITGPTASSVNADYDGTPKSGELPRDIAFKLFSGAGIDVTADGAWSVSVPASASATIGASDGILTLTGLTDISNIVITATLSGFTRTFSHIATLNRDLPPTGGTGGGGTSASDSTIASATSTSYGAGAGSDILTVETGGSGVITFTAPLSFKLTGALGSEGAYGKWLWRAVGGTFADVATEIASDYDANTYSEPPLIKDPGYIAVNMSKSGLTPNTTYEIELDLRRRDGGSGSVTFQGTATAVGS